MSLLDALLLDPAPFNVWIAIRTDGIKGSGTISDPYDGSSQSKFDEKMNLFAAVSNVNIHLGPGEFLTNGYNGTSGWQARPGMKILGSGIDVTTLKLKNVAPGTPTHYFAIGHSLASKVDAFEVADLTIDCNLAEANSNAACGGVRDLGNHTRISRIKVKGWGTKTTAMPCYAIAAITGDATGAPSGVVNCRIEECIVVEPGASVTNGIVTALHAGTNDESGGSTAEIFGTGAIIRNCFVDCGSPTATAEYRGLSMSWCRSGIVEGNQIHNTKYGGPYSDKTTIRELIVRNNYYKNVGKGPFWSLGNLCSASLTTGGSVSLASGVLTIGITSHNLQAGDRFKLVTASGVFNGTCRVDTVVSSSTVTVKTSASGSNTTVTTGTKKVFSSDKLLVEGNIVELATGSTGIMGIHIHDNGSGTAAPTPDGVHGEVMIRNNHIRYLDGAFDASYAGRGIEVNGAKNLLIHNNVLNVVEASNDERLRDARCIAVKYFNNRVPDGVLVRGVNKDSSKKYDELETDAEDAFVMAMFNER